MMMLSVNDSALSTLATLVQEFKTELLVSCGQGTGRPEGFYRACGFKPTGEQKGLEIVLRLELT